MDDLQTRDIHLELVEYSWRMLPLSARVKLVVLAWLLAFAEMRKSLYILLVMMMTLIAILFTTRDSSIVVVASIAMGVILGATIVYWLLRDLIHRG